MAATIIYRPDSQKQKGYFDLVLTKKVLKDICFKVTGQRNYIVEKDDSTYNHGRMLLVIYKDKYSFVSLSEVNIEGRNQSLQSVPTAINIFYADTHTNKQLFYYFLPHNGNAFTKYHVFMYKLMMTAGVRFLNITDYSTGDISPYNSVDYIIADRSRNQGVNASNNSSYISKTANAIQLYAKTFGASKYESTLFGVALSKIADRPVEIFNICEQDLKELPLSSRKTLESLGNVRLINTSLRLEKNEYLSQSDKTILRSPTYTYNLLNRIGTKHCALCNCEIPEIIQGAHIWGVSEISHDESISDDMKFEHAISGHNGLWMCQNHHKLFDSNFIAFSPDGHIMLSNSLNSNDSDFIRSITNTHILDSKILSEQFFYYLSLRNKSIDISGYGCI